MVAASVVTVSASTAGGCVVDVSVVAGSVAGRGGPAGACARRPRRDAVVGSGAWNSSAVVARRG
ncbi:hypothetical protein GCM10025864_31610 [Luteimicrobium album]|uniref:Secreted protein n=1 Tax=Luteimicrobium album TaxID=1054550 RepID=A0ABQ6I4J8_9MICO|nr:hypothetical protein [Luteimicrobium album]GMA25402.1 hypothetical protein GCM10025864_31610 [Luteimicrobium album]